MENTIEFQRNDRVRVNNVYGWDVSFYSDVARRDITIPAFATGYSLLTVDIVEEELLKQNFFFTGTDGLGDHAGLKICDPEMYKYLFRKNDETRHISRESIMDVLKLSNKQKFEDVVVRELIRTTSEARMCLYYMSDIDWSEHLGWTHDILMARCREFVPVV